jgi:hypothetical protein
VSGDPDRARAAVHDPGDRVGVQAGQHPQQDHLCLQRRQSRDRRDRGGGGQVLHGQHGRVLAARFQVRREFGERRGPVP